jgi:hypothetical protein
VQQLPVSCQINMEQRFVSLVIVTLKHALRVRRVRAWEHGRDEIVQIVDTEAGLLCQHMAFAELVDHVEDEGVTDDLEKGGVTGRLVREVNVGSAHDAGCVRLDFCHAGPGTRKHADKLTRVGHGGGAKHCSLSEMGLVRLLEYTPGMPTNSAPFSVMRFSSAFVVSG